MILWWVGSGLDFVALFVSTHVYTHMDTHTYLGRPNQCRRVRRDVKDQEGIEQQVENGGGSRLKVHVDGEDAVEGPVEEELDGDPDGLSLVW